MNIVTVIQARMGSSRFPGKVMKPLCGAPLLQRMVERVAAAEHAGIIVVAIPTAPEDDEIEKWCREANIHCFRGDENDLLDRHYQAGLLHNADAVVKIPSDCPLIDPQIIDMVLSAWKKVADRIDYAGNLHPPTWPDGNDVEVVSMKALKKGWQEAQRPLEREHTTPYFWENPATFKLMNIAWDSGLNYAMSHRWTIDYPEDYTFINRVYEELYSAEQHFSLEDILNLLEKKPEIMEINAQYAGVNWYRNHLNELKTVHPDETRFPDKKA